MGVRRWLLSGLFLSLCCALAQADVYRWKDASGRIIYGDNPPEGSKGAPLDLPPLTISDGLKAPEAQQSQAEKTTPTPAEPEQKKDVKYESFEVTAPQKDEALRANDGTISISLKLEPDLQSGHSVILYIDGKQVADGTELNYSIPNLDRGTHTMFAVIKNSEDDILINTEVTTFHVLRAKKKRKLKTTEDETSSK
ncbi:DUF4124 domain-containing protein [Thiofilum flexile]|uniref:DUF4124 domain-containing protein n=1 Tax=Thiofilum flexile TaxID=125627 RepID=UPI000369940B|nr:DUF4124 domain-containing protein [Thiofilum flexile]